MAEKTCISCGKTEKDSDKWLTCPNCGCNMCQRCGIQKQSEQSDIEKLRSGRADDRLQVTCPSCRYDMYSF